MAARTVPALPRAEAERLEAVLAEADEYEQQASRRVEAARELKTELINGGRRRRPHS